MRCEIYDLSSGVGLRGTWDPETVSQVRKSDKHIFKVVFEGSNKQEDCEEFFRALLQRGVDSQFVSELSIFEGQLIEMERRLRQSGSEYYDSYSLTWSESTLDQASKEPQDGWRRVTTRLGETLSDVAARVYGDPSQWKRLARANKIVQPLRIAAGRELRVPPKI